MSVLERVLVDGNACVLDVLAMYRPRRTVVGILVIAGCLVQERSREDKHDVLRVFVCPYGPFAVVVAAGWLGRWACE